MDALELLAHDHRMVEQLFRDYRAAASDTQRRAVVEVLVRELSKHAVLEELMVYPVAKEVLPDGPREVEQRLGEHRAVKQTFLALDRLTAGDERTDGLVDALRRDVEQHVRDDEGELTPRLRGAVSQQDLDELGGLLDEAKQTAPTRPHPHAPEEPPALALAAPVAAAYDRLRDRLQGRPRT
ncbi:cation-binding protein [Streptomyces sp. CC53]|uniref:hemerythrin domain-containing protein n=1 Tax=unclassified Streptomyces TaxID=2593676 RepID=UPI0008DC62E2|nr:MULTISPECIES: hemerythrin domain-containing protein [unclassified Streptomyces]OII65457.1 cation-binding protein [Streptomyces sp. CC53]